MVVLLLAVGLVCFVFGAVLGMAVERYATSQQNDQAELEALNARAEKEDCFGIAADMAEGLMGLGVQLERSAAAMREYLQQQAGRCQ